MSIPSAARRQTRPLQDEPNNSAGVVIRHQIAPSLSLGFSFPIQEESGPNRIAANATLTDSDSPDFAGGSLSVSIVGPRATDNIAVYPYAFEFAVTGGTLFYQNVAIGTVSGGGFGGATLTIAFNANATVAVVEALIRAISFEFTDPNPPIQEVRTFHFALNDGDGDSVQLDQNVNTFATNDAPVFANLDGDISSFTEDGPAVRLDQGLSASISDVDSANFNHGSLYVFMHTNGVPSEDVLGVAAGSGVSITGAVVVNGVVIGSATGGGHNALEIMFNSEATPARVTELVRALTYSNSNPNDPNTAQRTISLTLSDGGQHGGFDHDTVVALVKVNVTRVDDPPVVVPPPPGPPIVYGSGDLSDTVLSADGLRLYSVNSHDGIVNVYRAETGQLITSWNAGQILLSVDLSLDGRSLLATGYQILASSPQGTPDELVERTVATYKIDLATGTVTQFLYTAHGYDTVFSDVAFLDNGLALLSQMSNSSPGNARMKLLNIDTGQYTQIDIVSGGLAESLDGNRVFVSRSTIPGGLYDADTGFPANPASIASGAALAYSAEANLIVTAEQSAGLKVYDGNGQFLLHLSQYNPMWSSQVNGLAFDETGAFLFVLDEGDDAIYQLRTSDWAIVNTIAVGTFISSGVDLQVGPDMRYFTFFGSAGLLRVDNPFVTDEIVGTLGADNLNGTAGNDFLIGDSGADVMTGGTGDDVYYVDQQGDSVVETAGGGSDTIRAGASYVLAAGADVERLETTSRYATMALDLTGNGLANVLRGNNGANRLDGGAGADSLTGFGGNDTYYVDNAGDVVIEAVGQGADRVAASVTYALAAGAEIEQLEAVNSADTAAMDLGGNDFVNLVIGNAGVNLLYGLGGNDQLIGYGGNDFLIGGSGADIMYGGTGNDTFYVDDLGDRAYESAGEGTDRIATLITYTLDDGSEVELLEATNTLDTNAMDLTGSNSANQIIGNAGVNLLFGLNANDQLIGLAGNDFLVGGTGADIMYGGTGNDTFYVDDLGDRAYENGGEGNDRIATSISYTLDGASEIELLEAVNLTETNAMNLTGSESGQTIIGNDGVNLLFGLGGNDTLISRAGDDYLVGGTGDDVMYGGLGNDTYYVDSAFDQANELAGQGSDRVATSVSYTLSAEIETLEAVTRADTSALTLTGNAGANTIVGNDGANTLDGKGGNDLLIGYGGADTFAFTTAGNVDHIFDFASGTDKIALDDAIFGALGAGAFAFGAAAQDADDRIVYDAATGNLYFDADGNGIGAQILFAVLDGHPPLAASDFIVI